MDILIMSKENIENYTMKSLDTTPSIVVSISNIFGSKAFVVPNTNNGIKKVLNIEFNDTEMDDFISGGILDTDAAKIVNFISENVGQVDRIICQCDKGESRSAGVAKALMEYYHVNNEDVPEYYKKFTLNESMYHKPNKLVYEKMRKELNNCSK